MMKAVRIHDGGTAEVLCYEDAPTSEPGPREVGCQGKLQTAKRARRQKPKNGTQRVQQFKKESYPSSCMRNSLESCECAVFIGEEAWIRLRGTDS